MVRQAMFNLLGQALDDALVLDVCCGSGALGLEALSRGARHAWLVDRSPKACQVAQENVRELGLLDRVTVVCANAASALDRLPPASASLAFCDPPYVLPERAPLLMALARVVMSGGVLVFESGDRDTLAELPLEWERQDSRAYGGTRVHLLRRRA
jgi:16S rRNA (guanine966-N2)-methyltransferase